MDTHLSVVKSTSAHTGIFLTDSAVWSVGLYSSQATLHDTFSSGTWNRLISDLAYIWGCKVYSQRWEFYFEAYKIHYLLVEVFLLFKETLSVRGLFAPTCHSFQDTDIWIILFDPKYYGAGVSGFFIYDRSLIN